MDDPNFNTEEKLFANRIAFLCFKQHGLSKKAVWPGIFMERIKTLQTGSFEDRCSLLFKMGDEDDDTLITQGEMRKIFKQSFI